MTLTHTPAGFAAEPVDADLGPRTVRIQLRVSIAWHWHAAIAATGWSSDTCASPAEAVHAAQVHLAVAHPGRIGIVHLPRYLLRFDGPVRTVQFPHAAGAISYLDAARAELIDLHLRDVWHVDLDAGRLQRVALRHHDGDTVFHRWDDRPDAAIYGDVLDTVPSAS